MKVSREELKKYNISVPAYVPKECNEFEVTSGPRGKICLNFSKGAGFMLLSPDEINRKKLPEVVKQGYQKFYNKYLPTLKEEFFNY